MLRFFLKMNEVTERIIISKDWLAIVLVVTIGLIVFSKVLRSERFDKIQSLLYTDIYINDFSKATALLNNTFTYAFTLINSIVISLLLFIIVDNKVQLKMITSDFQLFIAIFIVVLSYILLRLFLGYLLGVLFEYSKEQQHISFLKISYLSNFSLLILPLLIVNYYINSAFFTYFLLLISGLLLLYYYAKIIKSNQKIILSSLFYFILYLCALEISPLLIIYKLVII